MAANKNYYIFQVVMKRILISRVCQGTSEVSEKRTLPGIGLEKLTTSSFAGHDHTFKKQMGIFLIELLIIQY